MSYDVIGLGGGIYLGRPGSETFEGSLRAAREWLLPHDVLDAQEIRRRFRRSRPPQILWPCTRNGVGFSG
jgi:sarcosine oxidase